MTDHVPALVSAPTGGMPTVERHRHALMALIDTESSKLDEYARLLPVADLQAIIAELETKDVRPVKDEALEMAKRLTGSYTTKGLKKQVNDPETYKAAIASVFGRFPRDIGWRAVDEITLSSRYLPERADVYAVLSRMASERYRLRRTAEAQIQEHERRREEAKRPKPKRYADLSPEERARHDALMRQFYDTVGVDPAPKGRGGAGLAAAVVRRVPTDIESSEEDWEAAISTLQRQLHEAGIAEVDS